LPTSAAAIAGSCLLDTGPLVAYLSSSDDEHARCDAVFATLRGGELFATEAVLTEAMHFLRRCAGGHAACLDFFTSGGAVLVPMTTSRLERAAALVARYADVPMDFADATLVALADELGVGRVLTLDRRGFSAYRWRRSRRFTLLP